MTAKTTKTLKTNASAFDPNLDTQFCSDSTRQPRKSRKSATAAPVTEPTQEKTMNLNPNDVFTAATRAAYQNEISERKAKRPAKITETFNVSGHIVTISETDIIINDDKQYSGMTYKTHQYEAVGALKAMTEIHMNKYGEFNYVGFRFLNDYANFVGDVTEAAVLTANASENEETKEWLGEFVNLIPEQGMVILGWNTGKWYVSKRIQTVPQFVEGMTPKQEGQAKKDIEFFKKHVAMDEILAGKKLFVRPEISRKVYDVETGAFIKKELDEKRNLGIIRVYSKAFKVSPEEAAIIVMENIENSISNTVDYIVHKKMEAIEIDPEVMWDYAVLVGGNRVPFREIKGQTLLLRRGIHINVFEVAESNLKEIATLVRDCGRVASLVVA